MRLSQLLFTLPCFITAVTLTRPDAQHFAVSPHQSFLDIIRSLPRNLKCLSSSSMESLILSCSMPTDNMPPHVHLRTLLDSIINIESNTEESNNPDAYEVFVRKTVSKLREHDWRSAAKALHTLHYILQGCSPYQSKIIARVLVDHVQQTRKYIEDAIHKIERQHGVFRFHSKALGGWRWVLAYLNYLSILADAVYSESNAVQYNLALDGPADLLAMSRTFFESAISVVSGHDPQVQTSLMDALKAHSAVMIQHDLTNFMASISQLEYSAGESHDALRLRALAEDVRKNLCELSADCARCLDLDTSALRKSPLLPRWILAL